MIIFFSSGIPSMEIHWVKTHFCFSDISLFCPLWMTFGFLQHFWDISLTYLLHSVSLLRKWLSHFSLDDCFNGCWDHLFFGCVQSHYYASKCRFFFLFYRGWDFLCFLNMKLCDFNFWIIFATLPLHAPVPLPTCISSCHNNKNALKYHFKIQSACSSSSLINVECVCIPTQLFHHTVSYNTFCKQIPMCTITRWLLSYCLIVTWVPFFPIHNS